MNKEIENSFDEIKHVIVDQSVQLTELWKFIEQHANVINFQKDNQIQGAQEMGIQMKSIQEDLDKLFDLFHKIESLPNMLSILQDFKKLDNKKNEKSKTD